jgi:phosphoribosylamine--glycine ligase
MKVLVIGSGGREHAICQAFARSGRVSKIFCANGNAGIGQLAELVDIKPTEIDELADFAEEHLMDLTFVGGETSLALGIVDEFEKRGLKIIGASKAAARLEASKSFAKDFMRRHNIPTADFQNAGSAVEAIEVLESGRFGDGSTPVVVKADGLAAGKGVVVATNRAEAIEAIKGLGDLVGEAAASIVLEECLVGREVSLIMFCDGESFALMPATRDHKRIGEGDTGPNTGGMGTITDDSLLTKAETDQIIETMIKPTLAGSKAEGFPFRGILFLGLMMIQCRSPHVSKGVSGMPTDTIPMLLEYNVRFGDPETQAILVRLESDLGEICEAMLDGRLADFPIKWRKGSSACIILAAEGYPGKPRTGDLIKGLEDAAMKDIEIFHSGTASNEMPCEDQFYTSGGRVLGVTSVGDDLETAIAWAYHSAEKISWPGIQYRRDIGK